ncbi:MAG TPA: ATP-dependent Clp protease ATP-binding subunit ClpX, partial [Chitinophagaceae bacterium]|nr:ATP-dependent Clp protease ATP-binding subunit ClpX [Chitinophagaceae bacterium]
FKSTTEQTQLEKDNLIQYVNALDLRNFGLIPELLGRLPVVTYLKSLDAHALRRILTEPKNALIKQYKHLFEYENIDLQFDDDALDYIVQKAIEFKLGGRGLRSICELVMNDAMFELPSQKHGKDFIITKEYAQERIEKSKYAYLKVA